MRAYRQIQDLDLKGKVTLMRVDFNVPLDGMQEIVDDTRLSKSLPSVELALSKGAKLVLMSHLGRPKGNLEAKYSLKPCVEYLKKYLKIPIRFVNDCIGEEVKSTINQMKAGELLVLENLRFYEGETSPQEHMEFVDALASFGDYLINDAFGRAHR